MLMTPALDVYTDDTARRLVTDMNTRGYATIPEFISPADLTRMQAFVTETVHRNDHEYAVLQGPDSVAGSGLDELARSSDFRALMERLYWLGTGNTPPQQGFYQILRCLTGRGAQRNSYIFHYDSYVITALISVAMPDAPGGGDLLMLPNTRRVRSRYLFNVLDKLLLDNTLTQRVLRRLVLANRIKVTRIRMVPGSLYFFWGYRSIHTNEPCDASAVRATALFHYANPHRDVA